MSLKSTEELSVMAMKNDPKFEFDIWNLTCQEFDEFWHEHLKVSKNLILMCSFWAKYILIVLKKYTGVIFHENEEEYKIWRGIDLSFQNWHKEFDKFWPEHSEVSNIFTLVASFWAKYIFFELKHYREVIFHETEEEYRIWSGIDLSFQNWHKKFDKFWPEHSEVSNIFTLVGSFWAKYILFELKKYKGVIFHVIEEWCKIWRKTDLLLGKCQGTPTRALHQSTRKCQNWNFDGILLSKIENGWA